MMASVVQATARPNFQVWLRFADGAEGIADLSDLAGRGVFARWNIPGEFEKMELDAGWGTIRWPEGSTPDKPEIDLCPDVLYHRVTGIKPWEQAGEAA
jgi:hypothetical protein